MPSTDDTLHNGPVWAAILAAAIGCACFGLLADLSEVFATSVSPKLVFYRPTGDLSGKSTIAVVVWLASWVIFGALWKRRNLQRTGWIAGATVVLVLAALVATFPPFFELLSGK